MEKEIKKSLEILKNGQVLLYPTDTVWGLGCDATNENAVSKIYKIKDRVLSKSLIILVDSEEMLSTYVGDIPENVREVLKTKERPTTIIYKNPKGLAKNVVADDNTVAIRIVEQDFCNELIKKFEKPIVSTSANISGKPTPMAFKEIEPPILEAVDYVVNLYRNKKTQKSSKIIKILDDGTLEVLRD